MEEAPESLLEPAVPECGGGMVEGGRVLLDGSISISSDSSSDRSSSLAWRLGGLGWVVGGAPASELVKGGGGGGEGRKGTKRNGTVLRAVPHTLRQRSTVCYTSIGC